MTTAKLFPIMISWRGTKGPCPSAIPWEAIAPYEGQAQLNHQQSLERLAERGGLSPLEALMVMTGRNWREIKAGDYDALEVEACAFLGKIVRDRDLIRVERDALLLQFEEARKIIAEVSCSPEFKKWHYNGAEQDPCGVHAFTAKYVEKPKHDHTTSPCPRCGTVQPDVDKRKEEPPRDWHCAKCGGISQFKDGLCWTCFGGDPGQ